MSFLVVTDANIWLDGLDVSGYSNETSITITPAMLDRTVFGGATKLNVPGLSDFKADVGGYMDESFPAGAPGVADQTIGMNSGMYGRIGANAGVVSIAPIGNSELDIAYTMQNVSSKFNPIDGKIGDLLPFKLEMAAAGIQLVRGSIMGIGAKIATGNSAAAFDSVTGVGAGQKLYAALHVFGSSGTLPSITVTVRSSAASNMSSPTTRLTFPAYTTTFGASWLSLAGAIADRYYDIKWTITGTLPSINIVAILGIL